MVSNFLVVNVIVVILAAFAIGGWINNKKKTVSQCDAAELEKAKKQSIVVGALALAIFVIGNILVLTL